MSSPSQSTSLETMDPRVIEAAREQYARRPPSDERPASQPDGATDAFGRWWPSDAERRPCCDGPRQPDQGSPRGLFEHCCTQRHVAALYGVDPLELRIAVRHLWNEWRAGALLQREFDRVTQSVVGEEASPCTEGGTVEVPVGALLALAQAMAKAARTLAYLTEDR